MNLQGKTLDIIEYRAFWDIPRLILGFDGVAYWMLDGGFDDELDEYSPQFRVYALGPDRAQAEERFRDPQWRSGAIGAGTIRVEDAEFDETRRKRVHIRSATA